MNLDRTPAPADNAPHVVIVGAGFAGIACAAELGDTPVRVTVIDRHNYHLFVPLLYQVATAALSPADIAEPVRRILSRYPNVDVVLGEVSGIDKEGRKVVLADGSFVPYDRLVLATGSVYSYFGHDDWAKVASGLKTIDRPRLPAGRVREAGAGHDPVAVALSGLRAGRSPDHEGRPFPALAREGSRDMPSCKPCPAAAFRRFHGWRAVAVVTALLAGPTSGWAQAGPAGGPPPAVTTVAVEARDVAPTAEFIGRTEAIETFEARPRVEGFLREVAFTDGQDVKAGQPLYTIEPGPYEAALASARAQLARVQAALVQARLAYERAEELRGRGNVSQAQLDEATATRDMAQADVDAAQAAVRTAELNLGYTRIASPIDGRLGVTAVTAGNLVTPSTGTLATVVRLDPIRVVFSVSDRDVMAVQQRFQGQSPQEVVAHYVPRLRMASGAEYPQDGKVEFVDNRVDPATGTIAVRALFPNPNETLLPGQFVTMLVRPERTERRPVVPVAAVQQDREGRFVLVLDDRNRVEQRRIEIGPQLDQVFAVESGLREGEVVVLGGVQKVQPGMAVQPTRATDTVAVQP